MWRHLKRAASFLVFCYYRDLKPKTMEFYRWGLRYLEVVCPGLPEDHRRLMPILGNHRILPGWRESESPAGYLR